MKGQVSIEFFAVFIIVFIIFLLAQANIFSISNSLVEKEIEIDAISLLDEAEVLINSVGYTSDLTVQFKLPAFLKGGYAYNFTVSNSSVSIAWVFSRQQKSIVRTIYVFNVTNSTGATKFILPPGAHFVTKNSNGVVVT